MKDKEIVFSIFIIIIIAGVIYMVSSNSYAMEYNEEYTLFYEYDEDKLESNVKEYIEEIDDEIVSVSSFNYSDILSENYDFITRFSIMYILRNKERYQDYIKNIDEYSYVDMHGINKNVNEYIDVKYIYEVSKKYFYIDNYNIINTEVNKIDDYVSLSIYNDVKVVDKISDIYKLDESNDYVSFDVKYELGDEYKYTFKIKYNIMYLYNVEVVDD